MKKIEAMGTHRGDGDLATYKEISNYQLGGETLMMYAGKSGRGHG